jgi:hypothetical protein
MFQTAFGLFILVSQTTQKSRNPSGAALHLRLFLQIPLLRSRFYQINPSDGSDLSLRFSKRQDSINGDDDTSGIRTENTLETIGTKVLQIAFTRVTQKPKVMSPQPLSRDVGIYCGMTSDQTSWRGNLPT